MGKLKRCPHCGEVFISSKLNINYCSEECKIEGKKEYKRQYIRSRREGEKQEKRDLTVPIMPKTLKCSVCGNSFPMNGRGARKKYCSLVCKAKFYNDKKEAERQDIPFRPKDEQPCWACEKACGSCSWSRSLKPIKGWNAEPISFAKGMETFKITYCPEYEREIRRARVRKQI